MKSSIVRDIVDNDRSLRDVATKTGISYDVLLQWRSKYTQKVDRGGDVGTTLQLMSGRPFMVNAAALAEVASTASGSNVLTNKELRVTGSKANIATNSLLVNAANQTRSSNGLAPVVTKMDPRTARGVLARIADAAPDLRKPRLLNPSRTAAVGDKRLAIAHAVFCKAFCYGRVPNLLFNSDATHFLIQHADKKTTVIFVSKGVGDEPRIATTNNALDYAIKYILTIQAAGGAAPDVFVFSDDSLEQEDMKWKKVRFLTHDQNPDRFGFLVFLRSRSGNSAFWRWYWKTVVLPYIKDTKDALFDGDCAVDYDEEGVASYLPSQLAVYASDGEAGQVRGVTEDPEILDLLDKDGVAVNKHGGGGSLLQQAADLTTIFMNSKSDLRSSTGEEVYNPALELSLSKALLELQQEGVSMDNVKQDKYKTGLMCVIKALTTHVTPAKIKKGFQLSGMLGHPDTWDDVTRKIPFGPSDGTRTKNTPYCEFSKAEWDLIDEKFEDMVTEYIEKGRLTDAFLDGLGMPRAEGQIVSLR
jgi:hypothetical protein